jgi:ABC-type lipoprotein export system ATPase subunit
VLGWNARNKIKLWNAHDKLSCLSLSSFTSSQKKLVGASGSGKTTFLNDVHQSHKCTYIRQYHSLRPYIIVKMIPNFDQTALPFWDTYVREETADSIQIGGTMAGEFTAGLSGGQRKLLLFELIYQRTLNQKDLLIVLDEPFAGVTDDFVPFIVERLNQMREQHNILLVTNDHIKTLKEISDNIITVSAIDRSKVKINNRQAVDRDVALHAMSLGESYNFSSATNSDWEFFWNVEVSFNKSLIVICMSTIIFFALFIATYWNSSKGNEALVLIAGGILAYFTMQPYLLTLVAWRNTMAEEAEALMHSSKRNNKLWKTLLTIFCAIIIDFIYFGCVNLVIDTLSDWRFLIAIIFDGASLTFPFLFIGIYSKLSFEAVENVGSLPFLMMIFFSTTFSPGSGIPGLKVLRYLFPRFYFWCMVPVVQDEMEGCPADEGLNLLYLVLSSMIGVGIFGMILTVGAFRKRFQTEQRLAARKLLIANSTFQELQKELYGKHMLERLEEPNAVLSETTNRSTLDNDITAQGEEDLENNPAKGPVDHEEA